MSYLLVSAFNSGFFVESGCLRSLVRLVVLLHEIVVMVRPELLSIAAIVLVGVDVHGFLAASVWISLGQVISVVRRLNKLSRLKIWSLSKGSSTCLVLIRGALLVQLRGCVATSRSRPLISVRLSKSTSVVVSLMRRSLVSSIVRGVVGLGAGWVEANTFWWLLARSHGHISALLVVVACSEERRLHDSFLGSDFARVGDGTRVVVGVSGQFLSETGFVDVSLVESPLGAPNLLLRALSLHSIRIESFSGVRGTGLKVVESLVSWDESNSVSSLVSVVGGARSLLIIVSLVLRASHISVTVVALVAVELGLLLSPSHFSLVGGLLIGLAHLDDWTAVVVVDTFLVLDDLASRLRIFSLLVVDLVAFARRGRVATTLLVHRFSHRLSHFIISVLLGKLSLSLEVLLLVLVDSLSHLEGGTDFRQVVRDASVLEVGYSFLAIAVAALSGASAPSGNSVALERLRIHERVSLAAVRSGGITNHGLRDT